MKRTPIKRDTRIKTKGKRRFKGLEYEDPEYLKKIEALPCIIGRGCMGEVVAHHVKTKGAGGKDRETIPLCFVHHSEWHDKGRISFQLKYNIDAPKEAALLAEQLAA